MFPDLSSTQQQAAVIVGFFLPILLAIPIQSHWPSLLKTLFAVGAYAGAGAVTAAASGTLTGKSFWQITLVILTLGVVGYQGVWKPSGLAPAIETHTSTLPARSQTPTSPSAPTGSSLEPQIADLLSASARLLEHATQRLAVSATENVASRQEQLERPTSQKQVSPPEETIQNNVPTDSESQRPVPDSEPAEMAPDWAAGPPLDEPWVDR
jgi:hypothetical protein